MKLKRPSSLEDDWVEGIIQIDAGPDGNADAVVVGKPFNWVRLCLYCAALAAGFLIGGYLIDLLGLFPLPQ